MRRIGKLIGWLFVPYVVIFFQWKKIKKPGKAFGVVWSLFSLLVVIGAINGGNNNNSTSTDAAVTIKPTSSSTNSSAPSKSKSTSSTTSAAPTASKTETKPNPKPTTNTVPAPKQTSTPSIDQQIRQTVADTISGDAVDNKQRYENVGITTSEGDQDKGQLLIDVHMYADDGWDVNSQMKSELQHAYDLDKALFTKYKNISQVAFWIDAPLKDQYGNVKNDLWCRFVIHGSDGYQIKYENMTSQELQKFYEWQYGMIEASKAWDAVQQ